MTYTETSFLLTMVKRTVEEHGCKLVDIDLNNQMIHLEGPEKNKTACALAIAEILG